MKKFCGRSFEKSRDQIFQKIRFFLRKMLFSHRQYTYQMNKNCLAVRMQKKIVWSHPRKNFKLLISLNVWTEIRFGQKIRYQHESSRQMICIDNMVLFLAQKFRTKFVFHAYTIIYLSRNFDISKIILQLSYIIRSGILCWFRITQSIRCLKVSVPVYWYAEYIRYWDNSLLSRYKRMKIIR